jgi:hypothetical protein
VWTEESAGDDARGTNELGAGDAPSGLEGSALHEPQPAAPSLHGGGSSSSQQPWFGAAASDCC